MSGKESYGVRGEKTSNTIGLQYLIDSRRKKYADKTEHIMKTKYCVEKLGSNNLGSGKEGRNEWQALQLTSAALLNYSTLALLCHRTEGWTDLLLRRITRNI